GAAAARDAVAAAVPLDWHLPADESTWARFPDGLPAGLPAGTVVRAETTTGLTTDASLDFLAIPPHSRLWASVAAISDYGAVRTVRLLFYRLQLAGGAVYPIRAVADALAAVPALTRVSAGGTIVAATPKGPPPKRPMLLDASARLRVRLLDPVDVAEPAAWWRAGPGLWLRTRVRDGRRLFEVSHVIAGRSADAAGLKPGDLLDAVDGRASGRLDFEQALDRLYGPPGSALTVSVLRGGRSARVTLTRGVAVSKDGTAVPLPLPFAVR
ncbi:MAG: hypothetical protein KGM24_03250, partial [Elusimicrobia bacterium]|nr:hypothetical protein [Elusimicrobiota bacterium]